MSRSSFDSRPRIVPSGRLNRATRIGTLTAAVAGNMAFNGLRQWTSGARPTARDLLLTPTNMRRVADELAKMRGAAMKIGQLASMDTGDVLPRELADILARLRADADFMPPKQLRQVLNAEWGEGWHRQFAHFDVRPIAAASIGQVHRAKLKDGSDLAIKVQYPGIARSIDSDVANVGRLIKLSGLLPNGFELEPYLAEAALQLHDEADYAKEASHLQRFGSLLGSDQGLAIPEFYAALSTERVLAMSYLKSQDIEATEALEQRKRDDISVRLVRLMFRELFEFGVMQTDPNFANYRYDVKSDRIVLLDFGATRTVPPDIVGKFRALLIAGISRNKPSITQAASDMALFAPGIIPAHLTQIVDMIDAVFAEITAGPILDLGQSTLAARLNAMGQALAEDGYVPAPIPMDLVFVQRKIAGMFLLATRLKSRLPVQKLLSDILGLHGCHAPDALAKFPVLS